MPEPVTLLQDVREYFDAYPCAARLGNHDLLIVFARCLPRYSPGPTERKALIAGIRSSDNGAGWSEPFTLIDTPDMLDYDPNIVAWDNKVMVISTTVPKTHAQKVTTSKFIAVRSEDNARTWSEPTEIPFPYVYCSGKINPGVQFPDGTLAFGFAPDMNLEKGKQVLHDADSWGEAGVMISRDDARTWTPGQTIGLAREKPADALYRAINGLDEPALAVCDDGSLYMLMRSGFDRLYEARSSDQGRTWTAPRRSALMAHDCPADICVFDHPRLGRGWLVIYDHSPQRRFPLAVSVSFDEGHNWSRPLIITGLGENTAYPTCVQTAAGPMLLVWQRDFFVDEYDASVGRNRTARELQACLLDLDEIDKIVD